MKKFLRNIFVITVLALILLFITNALYKLVIRDEDETVKFQEGVPDQILVSNVGTSHGQSAFLYDNLPITGFNFAIGSQDYTYDLRVIKNYIDKLQNGGVMLIPVSYCSLFDNSPDQFASANTRYYKFLSPEYIKAYSPKVAVFYKYFPICVGYEKVFSKTINKLAESFKKLLGNESEPSVGLTIAVSTLEDLQSYGAERYYSHVETHLDNETGTYTPSVDEKNALYELIDLCREKEITPVLITTPFLPEYSMHALENENFLSVFQNFILTVCSEKNVDYYDYSTDPRFCTQYGFFYDTDHLDGNNGSRLFTNTVLEEIVYPILLSKGIAIDQQK